MASFEMVTIDESGDRDPVSAMKHGETVQCSDCPAQLDPDVVMVFQPVHGPSKVVCQSCLVVNLTRELDMSMRLGMARATLARGA